MALLSPADAGPAGSRGLVRGRKGPSWPRSPSWWSAWLSPGTLARPNPRMHSPQSERGPRPDQKDRPDRIRVALHLQFTADVQAPRLSGRPSAACAANDVWSAG